MLANAGASQRLEADGSATWNRDATDERVIDDVTDGTGALITSYAEFLSFKAK